MSWPVSARYQTFVATVTVITAAFLNAVQDAIIGVIGGTSSVKAIVADGTGALAVTPNAGTLNSSTARSSATPGSGQAVPLGAIYKDTTIVGYAITEDAATLTRGANVLTFTHNGTGDFWITLNNKPATCEPVATINNNSGGASIYAYWDSGNTRFQVKIFASDGTTPVNHQFTCIFVGGG